MSQRREMKIKIDFDPRSEPSTLITLGIHHSRSDSLKFGFHVGDDGLNYDCRIFDTRHSAGRDIFHSGTSPRKQDVNYILARRRVDNDVCESLAKLAHAAITRS